MDFRLYLAVVFAFVFGNGGATADDPQWSFKPLADKVQPGSDDSPWIANPVDGFILEKLQEHDLMPQDEADRHSLVRRVSATLTGLPPSVEQIEDFLTDSDPGAYARMVDRLLASPHYGERWARHWLDVARFGESNGILTVNEDKVRGDAWQYRDAVIRALNADLPFDQFVRFQFVDSPEGQKAYRPLRQFIHLGTRLQNNADPNDKQFHRLDDMISTTGNAFLGMTLGCARCHDHPVDPVTTEEYYRFSAIFFDQVREAPKASRKKIPLSITSPRVLLKGNWATPGEAVTPGFIDRLMRKPVDYWQAGGKGNLQSLADWLTDTGNGAGQQLARVMVNRIWHYHFGRGLVATPNDFGSLGSRPSHPRLLDWLAAQLIRGGWKIKPIHRLILGSSTYRQSSARELAAAAEDTDNNLLWEYRPRRLEAEIIRDHLLSVAGVLRNDMFGRSISIGNYKKSEDDRPESWRRSIYLQVHRAVRHPTLSLFDPPDSERSDGARTSASSPESALFALNAPFLWTLSSHFAKRIEKEAGEDMVNRIEHAYMLALCRPPRENEIEIGLQFLRSGNTLTDYAHMIFGLNEFIYVH
ncbi:MAG: DUF1549 and DUF1553 domain-containing protein [Verrucomicrobiales bacterium]|nr:DUF1549 and DUF1553 domain-containing protein [Verrucomicrobiales bacterium]